MAAKAQLKINLPVSLLAKLEPVLEKKGLTVDEVCSLYLRSLVTASEKMKAIELNEEVTMGKFKGELLRVVILAEPRYVHWLLNNCSTFRISPEALAFLEQVTEKEAAA